MATLTRNLFHGQGERDHRLALIEGHWPTDVAGAVFVVGPDKRQPGGHWFGEQGLIEKIHLAPTSEGRIRVEHRRIATPVDRLRRRFGFLFAKVEFLEISPFGVTNLANTNVEPIAGRLFVGYDGGRPIEVDPETLRYLTPVGSNSEWLQGAPGILEPLCAVAAHPAADHEEGAIYFANYDQATPPGVAGETTIARWDLEGPVERWVVTGMSPFDSLHDVKVTEHHVVFTDLPFQFEPQAAKGKPRTQRNQAHTSLWIVAKETLRSTPPGGSVRATEVQIPMPTGHLWADYREGEGDQAGTLRVTLQHIPLSDLMLAVTSRSLARTTGTTLDPAYEGMVALGIQPSVIGRYRIDAASGEIRDAETVVDEQQLWGGILATTDTAHPEARARQRQLWYAGVGFDPDLVTTDWWGLYGDATDGVVAGPDLPSEAMPGTLARIDLEAMKVAEVWAYEGGAFPSPPTFVPRVGATDPDDGYIVVVVHQDGPKEIQIFDAAHIENGPLARASSPTFNPSLLLHSCWMPTRVGPRTSSYRVPITTDILGALRGIPGVLRRLARTAKAFSRSKPTV